MRNHGANMVSVPRKASSHGSRIGRNSRSLRRVVEPKDERPRWLLHGPKPYSGHHYETVKRRTHRGRRTGDRSLEGPWRKGGWDQPRWKIYLWAVCELLFVTNAWADQFKAQNPRPSVLRAEIGRSVVFRPRTRVKFPWKLHVGNRSWIGEGVWFHNQDHIFVGHDVVISQETFLTTGSHAHVATWR